MPKQQPSASYQRGSTMLEVLISIVVLSFGMLGLLGMMVNSLKMTSSSNYRNIAAQQLTAIADTIQASPDLESTYASATAPTDTSSCFSTGCTAGQEYGIWQRHVASVLPNGQGVVCRSDKNPNDPEHWSCTAGGRLAVSICWNESRISTDTSWSTACLIAQL